MTTNRAAAAAESPEVAWGGRRTSDQLVPKQYEATKLGEVIGSLQLAHFGMLSSVS